MTTCDCGDWYYKRSSGCCCNMRGCGCHSSKGYEVTRTVSRPVHRLRTPCSCMSGIPSHAYEHCWGGCSTDPCTCYECRRVLGRSESRLWKIQNKFCDHSSETLQRWFSKYDRDKDGYLNLEDLENFMDHMGARCHCEKLLKMCDRDCDGRLTFDDFTRMWRKARTCDQDLIRHTGCCDFPHLVKKYNLCFDHECPQCNNCSSRRITASTEHPIHSVKCQCGMDEKIVPFIFASKHKNEGWEQSRDEFEADPDRIPVMSHNRDTLFSHRTV